MCVCVCVCVCVVRLRSHMVKAACVLLAFSLYDYTSLTPIEMHQWKWTCVTRQRTHVYDHNSINMLSRGTLCVAVCVLQCVAVSV